MPAASSSKTLALFAQGLTARIKAAASASAEQAGRPFRYLSRRQFSKEALARQMDPAGLACRPRDNCFVWVQEAKMYDKEGSVLRIETTINKFGYCKSWVSYSRRLCYGFAHHS